jgi:Effector Associated Constant Component 1
LSTITARVGGELEHDSLFRLFRWLSSDQELGADATVSLARRPVPGSMGPMETIDVVVSNLIALASLATSVATWRSSTSARPEVTIVVNEIRVPITAPTEDELRELAEAAGTEAPGEDADTSG